MIGHRAVIATEQWQNEADICIYKALRSAGGIYLDYSIATKKIRRASAIKSVLQYDYVEHTSRSQQDTPPIFSGAVPVFSQG